MPDETCQGRAAHGLLQEDQALEELSPASLLSLEHTLAGSAQENAVGHAARLTAPTPAQCLDGLLADLQWYKRPAGTCIQTGSGDSTACLAQTTLCVRRINNRPPNPLDPDLPSADIRIDKISSDRISTRVRVRPRLEEALRTAREIKAHAPHCRAFVCYSTPTGFGPAHIRGALVQPRKSTRSMSPARTR
ncbi:hypothetical protein ACWGLF_41875 [Streptomyces puniciscabiei]